MTAKSLYERMLPAPKGGGFEMAGYWVWCASVVPGEDGRFHMFASRWHKYLPMHPGWLVHSEVVRAVSVTPEGPYEFEEIVLPARGAEYWDGRSTHNPHIVKHNGKYLLYYMGTTHPFPDVQPGEAYGLDPFIWKTNNGYEMIAKDMNGNIGGEKHGGIHAYSQDGLSWSIADNPKAYSRIIKWDDGTTQHMGNFERPFLLFQNGIATHLFAATADGNGEFGGKNTWNMVIPLGIEK
ncbi:glycoside hydrolase family protein [Paenibacillus sp. MCAF20]